MIIKMIIVKDGKEETTELIRKDKADKRVLEATKKIIECLKGLDASMDLAKFIPIDEALVEAFKINTNHIRSLLKQLGGDNG